MNLVDFSNTVPNSVGCLLGQSAVVDFVGRLLLFTQCVWEEFGEGGP